MGTESDESAKGWNMKGTYYTQHPSLKKLTPLEKKFLLAVEHGDASSVEETLSNIRKDPHLPLDVNCRDPVGRSATLMAIDNENLQMLKLLLEYGVESRDSLLHAINAEYVEAVELLLDHEETTHQEDKPHSWEMVDRDISSFTPEITPLLLAAHKDNYEILKVLLDRGATLPMPHDIRCRCGECIEAMNEDCLCHSRSRINAYRALSSPSLICLSSIDPILTAFELSWELRRLSIAENEFKEDYQKLRFRCQDFATSLLAQTRSSQELGIILNHDPTRTYEENNSIPLSRIEMALKYKQKKFIAHPNVQQLLSSLWYDGLPGFRRLNSIQQLLEIIKIGVLFPLYAVLYMLFPNSQKGKLIRKPFFKFILHSFSYLFFLFLLILASVRVETVLVELFGTERMKFELMESLKKQRGQPPTVIETSILLYIIAHVWQEIQELYKKGVVQYCHNMWNIIDFTRNTLHVGAACMRVLAYIQAQTEIQENPLYVYVPREAWDAFDPMLIADGLFAAGNVFAALKLIHIFSINPYLGPLQISLGRMVIDIIKFFSIYTLVLFAFACGLNQLLWYYADREKTICFSGPGGTENWVQQRDACLAWRRFSNLFESSQTLFWASFGLLDISNFELSGIKGYTRFWGLLMFGCYSIINVVVLLNLLIAMMSNSYQIISERSDEEWKFARTRLFMTYFEVGGTAPPPFNVFPSIKKILKLFQKDVHKKQLSFKKKEKARIIERNTVYQSVMCNLVWRYVTAQQKACESDPVTEDHIKELRQDVSSFRHDLMHVLRCNGMNTKEINIDKVDVPPGRKVQIRERRLMKNFTIGLMEVCADDAAPEVPANKSVLARLVSGEDPGTSQKWRDLIQLVKNKSIIDKTKDIMTFEETSLKSVSITNGNISSTALKDKDTDDSGNVKNVDGDNLSCLSSPAIPIQTSNSTLINAAKREEQEFSKDTSIVLSAKKLMGHNVEDHPPIYSPPKVLGTLNRSISNTTDFKSNVETIDTISKMCVSHQDELLVYQKALQTCNVDVPADILAPVHKNEFQKGQSTTFSQIPLQGTSDDKKGVTLEKMIENYKKKVPAVPQKPKGENKYTDSKSEANPVGDGMKYNKKRRSPPLPLRKHQVEADDLKSDMNQLLELENQSHMKEIPPTPTMPSQTIEALISEVKAKIPARENIADSSKKENPPPLLKSSQDGITSDVKLSVNKLESSPVCSIASTPKKCKAPPVPQKDKYNENRGSSVNSEDTTINMPPSPERKTLDFETPAEPGNNSTTPSVVLNVSPDPQNDTRMENRKPDDNGNCEGSSAELKAVYTISGWETKSEDTCKISNVDSINHQGWI